MYPPTSLIYISSSIRDAGHEAEIVDIPYLLKKYPDQYNLEDGSLYDYILSKNFDVLGCGGVVSTYFFYEDFIKAVREKKKDIPIIVGGTVGVPILEVWENFSDVNYLVEGDGEEVIKQFCKYFENNNEKLNTIPGLYINQNGKFKGNPPKVIKNIDKIPFLNYDEIDYEYYIEYLTKWVYRFTPDRSVYDSRELRLLPILMSRGCPFLCSFCFHFNRTHRYHTVEYVINNIKYLQKKYNVNLFYIIDDLFIFRPKWVMELCDEIIAQKLNVYFFAGGGKPSLINKEMLLKMKAAGFIRFSYGIESGSQTILDKMKKKTAVKQNYNALKMADEVGIPAFANMMLGHPGETEETIKETTDFLKKLCYISNTYDEGKFYFSWAVAYPGTPLFEELKKRKVIQSTDDIREYLMKVGSVGKYVYNFTDIPRNKLEKLYQKMINDIDRSYYLSHTRYIKALLVPFRKHIYRVGRLFYFLCHPREIKPLIISKLDDRNNFGK